MISIPEINLSIYDITGKNAQLLPELIALYEQLFPNYKRYLRLMELRAKEIPDINSQTIEHQWLGFINNTPATITIFTYLKRFNFGVGLDIGIAPSFRPVINPKNNLPLSEILTQLTIRQIIRDARKNHAQLPLGLVVEVESDKLVQRYRSYGFKELPVSYQEPPFVKGKENLLNPTELSKLQFQPMHLGIFPIRKKADPTQPEILRTIIEGILCDHYHLDFDHWAIQQAFSSLRS